MARNTTYAELKPGEKIHHAMKWRRVLTVGDIIPDDGRVPITVRDEKTDEERVIKIQARTRVMAY